MREGTSSESSVEISPSQEAIHFNETHERVHEFLVDELHKRNSRKIYHDPRHSLGDGERLDVISVKGMVLELGAILKRSFPSSLSPEFGIDATQLEMTLQGMEAGAIAHDVIIEIDGIAENGTVKRRRGWSEGGNERESFRLLRREFLKQYLGADDDFTPEEEELVNSLLTDETGPEFDAAYKRYIEAAERTICGTDPDGLQFFYEIDPHKHLRNFEEGVWECLKTQNWTEENPQYACVIIDSTKTQLSLEGLLGSTADLGAVSNPRVFVETGSAEFWEWQYAISKDSATFLGDQNSLEPSRVAAIVEAMQGWRRTQVGVALGQKIRIEEKYTPENISRLFEITFGHKPEEAEVNDFIEQVKEAMAGADESVIECARIYSEFTERFRSLIERDTGPLTDEEKALFTESIQYMNTDKEQLSQYVAHVEEELAKLRV